MMRRRTWSCGVSVVDTYRIFVKVINYNCIYCNITYVSYSLAFTLDDMDGYDLVMI